MYLFYSNYIDILNNILNSRLHCTYNLIYFNLNVVKNLLSLD